MSIYGLGLTWALEPSHGKLFFEFLAIVCLITVVRTVTLALTLFKRPGRAPVTVADVLTQRIHPDRLAKAALVHAVSTDDSVNRRASDDVRQMLRLADITFQYQWSLAHARVIATNRLLRLTLLLAMAITSFGVYPAFRLAYDGTNRTAYWAWYLAGELVLTRLGSGIAVCILLAIVAMFFEGCLLRRQAAWRRFYAIAMDEGRDGA